MSQDLQRVSTSGESTNTPTLPTSPARQWFKRGGTWFWLWDFGETQLKIVNEATEAQMLVCIRNDLSKESRAVAIVPKSVIEDMYKDLAVVELEEMKVELARLSAKLIATEVQLEEMQKMHGGCAVEVSEEEEEIR